MTDVYHRAPEFCPACNRILDAAANLPGETGPPAPGDVSWCIYCVTLLIVGDDGRLRLPTAAEERSALEQRSVRKARAAIYAMRRLRALDN